MTECSCLYMTETIKTIQPAAAL